MSVADPIRLGEQREPPAPADVPSRGWIGRISFGHGLMVAAGLLAALLNFVALRGGTDVAQVVTAARDIQPGEILTGDLLSAVRVEGPWAELDGLFAAERIADLEGSLASSRIAAGEPILRSSLAPRGSDDGLRAMSVPVDPAHAVGGRLRVGDRVDVIEVIEGGARFIATDVEVIGVADPSAGGALGGLGSYSVTLAVDDSVALRLASGIRGDRLEIVRSTGAPAPSSTERRDDPERQTATDAEQAGGGG